MSMRSSNRSTSHLDPTPPVSLLQQHIVPTHPNHTPIENEVHQVINNHTVAHTVPFWEWQLQLKQLHNPLKYQQHQSLQRPQRQNQHQHQHQHHLHLHQQEQQQPSTHDTPASPKKLREISKCDCLTPTTPALPNSETNSKVIQDYKDEYPDVVACLCLAADRIEEPNKWIAQCDDFCTVTVSKKQIKVFQDFEVQLSCHGGGSGSGGRGSPKAPAHEEAVAAATASSLSSSQESAQPAPAPPVKTPAPAVAAVALDDAGVANVRDVANKPNPKPAAASASVT